MPTLNAYGTLRSAYALAMPPDSLWPTGRLRSGIIPVPTKTAGTGTGTLDVTGQPHDWFSVVVECVAGGQINRSGIVNPGALPTFKLSLDGVTFTRAFPVSCDNDTAYLVDKVTGLGCGLVFVFSGTTPTFVAGDRWTLSVEPSPDAVELLEAAASACSGFLWDTFRCGMPLTAWPKILEQVQANLWRWALVGKCGLDKDQDHLVYAPTRPRGELMGLSAQAWLEGWQRGERLEGFSPSEEGAVRFPRFVHHSRPYSRRTPLP